MPTDQDKNISSLCSVRGVFSCGYNSARQTGTRVDSGLVDTFMPVERDNSPLMNIVQVTCGEYFSTFLTNDFRAYSCGQNHHGQCGVGHLDAVISPTLITDLVFYNIVNITCGYYHTIYQTDTGDVWTVGCANDGRLGLGPGVRSDVISPVQIHPKTFNYERVTKVSCGGTFTLFLTEENNIFACGWNSYGQLGLNSNVTSVYTVQQVKTPVELLRQKIKEIVCGACHTVFLTENDEAWAVGWNTYGQLGIGTLANQHQPIRVNINNYSPIQKVVCGYYQTFFFTNTGVLSCGCNQSGILCRENDFRTKGKNKKHARLINIHRYFNSSQIVDVRVGDYHALFLTEDGQVWMCGENNKGQLGLPNKEIAFPPQSLPSDHIIMKGVGSMDRITFSVGRNHSMIYYTKKEKRELNWLRFRQLMLLTTEIDGQTDKNGFVDCFILFSYPK
jgi:E3 ubiquitin-protein ligase HERC4